MELWIRGVVVLLRGGPPAPLAALPLRRRPVPLVVGRAALRVLAPRSLLLVLVAVLVVLDGHLDLDSARVQEGAVEVLQRLLGLLARAVPDEPELTGLAIARAHDLRVRNLALEAKVLPKLLGRVVLGQVLHDDARAHRRVAHGCRGRRSPSRSTTTLQPPAQK